MVLTFLFHPVVLTAVILFSFWWLNDLISGGGKSHAIKKAVMNHVQHMGGQDTEKAWEGLSFELKVKLTDKKRLKKGGKMFVGTRRVADFSARHSAVYNKGNLVIDSVKKVKRVRAPKQTFIVRLRSKVTGTIRLSLWISKVPNRADGWGITDVCIHPASGDLYKGETLTGAKMAPPKVPKKDKKEPSKRRSLKDDAA